MNFIQSPGKYKVSLVSGRGNVDVCAQAALVSSGTGLAADTADNGAAMSPCHVVMSRNILILYLAFQRTC